MYNSTITYTSQIGAHISQLFTGYPTDDEALLKAKDWVNETIKRFRYKPATQQNCRVLMDYIREKWIEMYRRPWSIARNELMWQCMDRIDILKDAIDFVSEDDSLFQFVEAMGLEVTTKNR